MRSQPMALAIARWPNGETSGALVVDRYSGTLDATFGIQLTGLAARLRSYARRLTGSMIDAEDLMQDTMLRCWSARQSFQSGTNLIAWARTVMRNVFLSNCRRARFRNELSANDLDRLLRVEESQSHAIDLHDVERAMEKLPAEQREAVFLASQGVTVEDAALQLAIPPGTFKSRVWRGRLRLQHLIHDAAASQPGLAADICINRRRKSRVKNIVIG